MAPKGKAKSKGASKQLPQPKQQQPKPDWPLLQPLLPASDLTLEELVPDQIVLIRNLWTSRLCKDYVSFLSTLPLTTTPGKPKKGEAVRVNDRFQIDDPAFAERLWSGTGLSELILNRALRGNPELSDASRSRLWGGKVVSDLFRIPVYRRVQPFCGSLASIQTSASIGIRKDNFLTSTVSL